MVKLSCIASTAVNKTSQNLNRDEFELELEVVYTSGGTFDHVNVLDLMLHTLA